MNKGKFNAAVWILVIAGMIGIPLFFKITIGEAFFGFVTTLIASVTFWALFKFTLQLIRQKRNIDSFRLWIVTLIATIALVMIPDIWMAQQLAPEREAFRHEARTACRPGWNSERDEGSHHYSMDCNGALNNVLQQRERKLAKRGFSNLGDWHASDSGSFFNAVYFYFPFTQPTP